MILNIILLKLFQKYFVNWIADGYIGKELNIFEISTIGEKTDKEVLLKLFIEFYGRLKYEKIIKYFIYVRCPCNDRRGVLQRIYKI